MADCCLRMNKISLMPGMGKEKEKFSVIFVKLRSELF